VNRLIRTGFGPFQLGELPRGGIEEVPTRAMKSSIGEKFFKKEDDAHRRRKIQRP
jgi:23S rRNA pseudouridine2605 synthase